MVKKLFYFCLFGISILLGCISFAWATDMGEILSGETKPGLLESSSQIDSWTFSGQAGDRVIIYAVKTSGTMTGTYLKLYPLGGGLPEAESLGNLGIDHQLQNTGSYTITVQVHVSGTGGYNITFLKIPGSVSSLDGGPIASGETLSGTIDPLGDLDAFQFYGQAGNRVYICAVKTSGTMTGTYLRLYPPDGEPREDEGLGALCIDRQLEKTGLYTITVEAHALNGTGGYNISLTKIPGAVSSPGDLNGGIIDPPCQTLSGTINPLGDLDAFQFYGQAGDRVYICAVKTSGTMTGTYLRLYPPDGEPREDEGLGALCIDRQLEKTGLYTITVEAHALNGTGGYNISLTKIPCEVRPGIYNPYPQNGSTICDLNGSFSWDPVVGATGYDLYFGEDVVVPLVKICDNVTSPSCPFPAMETGNIYYWHVAAHTTSGDIEGPYWWFQVSDVPDISVNPVSVDFGSVNVGSTSAPQTITISNTCAADLVIDTITITGSNASEFAKQNDNCSGHTIAPSYNCTVQAVFSPASTGSKSATLSIPSNDPDTPILGVPLNGIGIQIYTLTVMKSGTGTGTITSSPAGINCGADCSETYPKRTKPIKVTLKAKADTNSYFAGWSGDCTGTKPTCTLTMNSDKNVTATFNPNPTLTLSKSGDGKGTIKSAPPGIDCGLDCTSDNAQFKYKIKVTMIAKADRYSTFLGWGGDCQVRGTKPTCTIKMDSDKNITASFGLPDISVSPTSYDFGSVKVNQSSISAPFTIYNNGIGNLQIKTMKIIGTDAKMFKIKGSTKKTIPPGGNYQFTVVFKPTSIGLKTAILQITSNDPDTPTIEIPLSGTGI